LKQLPILFSILFLVMLGFGIIIPVLPFYAEELGASEEVFGWLMTSYSIMQFIFAPIWGRISDRFGRKSVLLIGLTGYIFSFIVFALSTKIWMLFAARIMSGILSSATLPTAKAIVADLTTEEERGKGMGILGAGMGLGFIFGPAIGGLLTKYALFGLNRLATPFLFTALLAVVPLVLTIFVLKESLNQEQVSRSAVTKPNFDLKQGTLTFVYLAAFVVSFTLAGLEGTFAYYAKDRAGIDAHDLGYIFAIMGVASAFVQGGMIGKLINHFGEKNTIKIGLVVSGIGFSLLILAHQFWTLTIFLTIFGLGNGMMRPSITSLISKKTLSGQGTAIGLMDSMDSMGRIAGPPIAGTLYIYFMESPYILGALLTFAFLLLFHVGYKEKEASIKQKEIHNH